MSRLSEHHEPKAGVEGKCSVPMWQAGCPSGFCDRPAFGVQFSEESRYAPAWWPLRDRNGYLINPNGLSKPYASGLCCDHHGGPAADQVRFMRDGNMWCAFMPGFENLQESIAGFGETQGLAEADLKVAIAKESGGQS